MMNFKLIKDLTEIRGISSYEYNVVNYLKNYLDQRQIPYKSDGLNSLVAYNINNKKPKIMLAAHMDEVGFLVKDIDDNGFIMMQTIGSWWSHLVAGQLMDISTQEGKVYMGVVGSLPTHGIKAEVKAKTMDIEHLYLDLGVSSKTKVLELGIRIGDMITPHTKTVKLNEDGYLLAKAFDDRIGDYIALEVLNKINKDDNLYVAFTTLEEPGLRGARTATNMIKPDLAIAIDTTLAGDTPLTNNICKLGGGVVLSMIDSNSIAPRKLIKYLENLCDQHHIPYQYAVFNGGGTDSGNIHKSFNGIINMTLSIPIRYMHTNHSIINNHDVEACIKLIKIIIKEMNFEILNSLEI